MVSKAVDRALDEKLALTPLKQLCLIVSGNLSPADVHVDAWPAIVAEAGRYGLAPYLLWVIDRCGRNIPAELDEQLRQAYRVAVTRSMILQKGQRDIAQALDTANIPHIWLKGIVLAATVYPDPALRPMVDLDLLVQPADAHQALDCLSSCGYHRDSPHGLFDPNQQAEQGKSHHYVLRGGPAQGVLVELHTHLLNLSSHDFLSGAQEQWFHQQTARYMVDTRQFTTFSNEAHFLYLCAHMVLHHGLHELNLVRPLDLHCLISENMLNWDAIIARATELRWTYAVERAIETTESLYETLLPSGLLGVLRSSRSADEDVVRIESLSQSGANFEGYRRHLGQLEPGARIGWVLKVALPRPAYMRRRYDIPADQWVWPYYLRRWRGQLREVAAWSASQRRIHKAR